MVLCLVEVTRGQSNEKLVFIGFFFLRGYGNITW